MQHFPDQVIGAGPQRRRRVDAEPRQQVLDLPADALGDGGQHQVATPQRVKAHPRRKQRVPGAGQNRQRLGPQRFAPEAVRRRWLIQASYNHVELAGRQQRQQLLRAPLLQPHPDRGVGRLEPGQRAGQHAGRRHRQGAKRDPAAARAGQQIEVLVQPAKLDQDVPGGPDEHGAGFRRAHAAGMAFEQPELQHVLQLVQALGQCRLADPEGHRRLEQAPVPLDGVHRPQRRQAKALVQVVAGRHRRAVPAPRAAHVVIQASPATIVPLTVTSARQPRPARVARQSVAAAPARAALPGKDCGIGFAPITSAPGLWPSAGCCWTDGKETSG